MGGCATYRSLLGRHDTAALLLPTTGEAASIGQNMARAASLVVPTARHATAQVYDTADTPEGARIAARKALAGRARMLFGPLRADQTPPVLAEAGKLPVVSFSNDDRLTGQGAFVMGLTPAQSVATVFSYARAQGVKRVAVVAAPARSATTSADAARELAAAGGLTLTATLLRDAGRRHRPPRCATPAAATCRTRSSCRTAALRSSRLRRGAVRLRGAADGRRPVGRARSRRHRDAERLWFAAPPPQAFVQFLDTFEARFGERPAW